jgi:hypothetical protein
LGGAGRPLRTAHRSSVASAALGQRAAGLLTPSARARTSCLLRACVPLLNCWTRTGLAQKTDPSQNPRAVRTMGSFDSLTGTGGGRGGGRGWPRGRSATTRRAPAVASPSSVFRDKNRGDIGKSQSMWTDSKMGTAGAPGPPPAWPWGGSPGRTASAAGARWTHMPALAWGRDQHQVLIRHGPPAQSQRNRHIPARGGTQVAWRINMDTSWWKRRSSAWASAY